MRIFLPDWKTSLEIVDRNLNTCCSVGWLIIQRRWRPPLQPPRAVVDLVGEVEGNDSFLLLHFSFRFVGTRQILIR